MYPPEVMPIALTYIPSMRMETWVLYKIRRQVYPHIKVLFMEAFWLPTVAFMNMIRPKKMGQVIWLCGGRQPTCCH